MISIDSKTIELTLDNHLTAAEDGNMDPECELDVNLNELRWLLNQLEDMGDYRASAGSELLLEVMEDFMSYLKIVDRRNESA